VASILAKTGIWPIAVPQVWQWCYASASFRQDNWLFGKCGTWILVWPFYETPPLPRWERAGV